MYDLNNINYPFSPRTYTPVLGTTHVVINYIIIGCLPIIMRVHLYKYDNF